MMVDMKIEIENRIIEFNVQYEKRKKLLIHIDSVGFITVRVPKNTSEEIIIKSIREQDKWILDKLDEITKVHKMLKMKEYSCKEKFLYIGKKYFIHELIDTNGLNKEELIKNLKKFYISSCKKVVGERIKIYQQQLKVKPKTVKIVESKTKWGSCDSGKNITFNYRLIMAPVEVIDYVIIHELCHIIHMNHDRSFWRRVGSIMRDYEKKEEFLTKYAHHMTI